MYTSNIAMKLREFLDFVREQGVVGLAIGFIIGGVTKDVVTSLVNDLINPLVGLLLPHSQSLGQQALTIGSVHIRWGNFLLVVLNFVIMCAILFVAIRLLRVSAVDKKK